MIQTYDLTRTCACTFYASDRFSGIYLGRGLKVLMGGWI